MSERDQRFKFLLTQFQLHSQRLHDFHSERHTLTLTSVLAIFAYYGWIFTYINSRKIPLDFVLLVPIAFVVIGFVYIIGINRIIDRHGAFLDHLEREMFAGGHSEFAGEWAKFKASGHQGKPLRKTIIIVWIVLLVGTISACLYLKRGIT